MKKNLLFFCLLFIVSISKTQTISSQKGLTTAVFSTQYGNVKVYLPDDIRPGDMISGTVVAEPKGNNARQTEKNIAELTRFTVNVNGNKSIISSKPEVFKCSLAPNMTTPVSIDLTDPGGNRAQLTIPLKPIETPGISGACAIPSHALVGEPARIAGNFDGDINTTQCLLNDQPTQILAESPRQCIIQYPATGQGQQSMQIKENGEEKCTRQISGVDMQVTTGDLNLRKGQSTYIDVKITRLENLPDKAILTITNITPNVVAMTNGNVQVIPIWPTPDSAHGSFSIHCPAVSITTGNFVVEINLDLPQPGDAPSTTTEIPPGYTKKSCECGVTATVSKSGNTFKAVATPQCKGVYGVGINTFPGCTVQSTSYKWSVAAGQENVVLTGKTDGPNVNVQPKSNGGYTVCVTVTVVCIDGTVCTTTVCADQAGTKVDPPTTQPKDPTTPTKPKDPPTTGDPENPTVPGSRCSCSASCQILVSGKTGSIVHYSAKVDAKCTGTFGTGNTRSVCGVGPIKYSWNIGDSGKGFAEINGKSDGSNVDVKLKGEGPYTLYLSGTVTCSDGTVCTFACNEEVPYTPTTTQKVCQPDIKELPDPPMDGGLKSKSIGIANSTFLPRDEFIALEAEGADFDLVKLFCNPKDPCPDTRSEKTISLAGRVRYEWVIEGDNTGTFVKLGCLPDDKSTEGEHVIFKPPVVPLPVKTADTTVITTIKLSVIDDGSPIGDATRIKNITIKTKRSKANPDKYTIEIISDKYTLPSPGSGPSLNGSCSINGPNWEQLDDLSKPVIELPSVPDNDKMVLGQWIVLQAVDQKDNDLLKFNCVSSNCIGSPASKTYPDLSLWDWSVSGGGKIILNPNGRFIIYEAPMEMPKGKEVIEVKITVTVKNPGGPRKDKDKPPGEIILHIYQPGVKLSQPDLAWLPEEDNSLELKSELMYKDGTWKPALAHMCRIHYFELMNVSTEKGVCLNAPVPKDADQCRDLTLKNEKEQEAFDDAKMNGTKCDTKELYQQARTRRPEKEYTITVYSRDFGSYGFLRSFANINKKTSQEGKPVYVSIPVKKTDVVHPQGRPKKTEYTDNRVTIPYDIDENHIADNGWPTMGGVLVPDPANNNEDEDDKPTGDGFKGDGLSSYEEYRGFKIVEDKTVSHTRANYKIKDIFVRNENNLKLDVYVAVSGLQVHEINENQYVDDKTRVVNPNFNSSTHVVNQMGLHLVDKKNHSSLLGIAYSATGQPTIPNQEIEIRIYSVKIAEVCKKRKLEDKLAEKIKAVVAHELVHGNNVCHHGEQDPEIEKSFNLPHGLRSGNVDCVMRYDNAGDDVKGYSPEDIGSDLCTSATGTGYNANGQLFGDAAAKRGNCKGQIRVSGKGNPPKSCGNR